MNVLYSLQTLYTITHQLLVCFHLVNCVAEDE